MCMLPYIFAQHPLCSGKVKPLKLRLHFDANGLQCVHEECSDYSKVVAEQAAAIRTQQDEMVRMCSRV